MDNKEASKNIPAPITIGSKADAQVTCANCGREGIASDFFTYQGKDGKDVHLCVSCRDSVNQALDEQGKGIYTVRAVLLGFIATVVGAVIWYYIGLWTGLEFGYVALGLGYLVGHAVMIGAGRKRARKLQIISALLVVLGILFAQYFLFHNYLHEYMNANPAEFEWWDGQEAIWVDPWNPAFLESFVTPIGFLIYAFGIYIGYMVCKPQKL